jgi:hypothetical protein
MKHKLIMGVIFGVALTTAKWAGAEVQYRFFVGPYPTSSTDGPTNPALCTDAAELWYSTPDQACQGLPAVYPNCDRRSATYSNFVARLTSPSTCFMSWDYQNVGSSTKNSWSASFGIATRGCADGFIANPTNPALCVPIVEIDYTKKQPQQCQATAYYGNPVNALTGAKLELINTGVAIGGIGLRLTYDTTSNLPASQSNASSSLVLLHSFGAIWQSSFHHKLQVAGNLKGALLSRGMAR